MYSLIFCLRATLLPRILIAALLTCGTFVIPLAGQAAPSSLPILPIPVLSALSGQYAFLIQGETLGIPLASSRMVGAVGSFTADGYGNITSGTIDINSAQALLLKQTLTGSYTYNSTGHGIITLNIASGQQLNFAVVLYGPAEAAGPASTGGQIEYLGYAIGHGTLAIQTPADYNSSYSGTFDAGLVGETACLTQCKYPDHPAGPVTITGNVYLGLPSIANGVKAIADVNIGGEIALGLPTSGIYNASPDAITGRTTASVSYANEPADLPKEFVIYVIDANRYYVLSSNSHATYALLSGAASTGRSQ